MTCDESDGLPAGPQPTRSIGDWTELRAPDGRLYYFNDKTSSSHGSPLPRSHPLNPCRCHAVEPAPRV
eukprot:761841-Hanusia_phi.AAC.7